MIAPSDGRHEKMQEAALRAQRRADAASQQREPSFAARLGQIGVLGWAIVAPVLIGVVIGRWLDRTFATGVFFTAPLIMLGAAAGLWTAWRWMHRQ
ncbi:MAG: AtpZ/AtpI family protein [Roseiarcus sp.]|uniref:AtpZ/AtpI family protein n=1 Tax=Roseiarcus sp. TaxID=1969460 RepID=UPI003C6292FC